MNEILSNSLQFVLVIVLPVLAGAATAWLIKQYKVQSAKLDQETQTTLNWIASTAVRAAEQEKVAGLIDDKLERATAIVQSELEQRNIKLDLKVIETYIQAAVWGEFNKAKYEASLKTVPTDA